MRLYRAPLTGLLAFLAVLALVGCNGMDTHNPPPPLTASLRTLQGNATAATVAVSYNGNILTSSLPYLSSSSYSVVPDTGQITIQSTSAGGPAGLPTAMTINMAGDSHNTFILDGWGANGTAFLQVADDTTAAANSSAKLRIVDGAISNTAVDVYVRIELTPPTGSPTFTNMSLNTASTYQTFVPGTYEVFFTTAGTTNVLLQAPVTLGQGQNRTVVLLNNCQPQVCNPGASFTTVTLADLN